MNHQPLQSTQTTLSIVETFARIRHLARNIKALSNVKDEKQKQNLVLGEKVYSTSNVKNRTSTEIDLSNQPTGLYFYKVAEDTILHTGKLVIE